MDRPDPPASPETVEDLCASFEQTPDEWLMYLRNCDQYMLHLERSLNSIQKEKDSQEKLAQTAISERDGIIRYQRDQFMESQQRISQLEVEKIQLAAAASPAVQTPVAPAPVTAAKALTDDPTRPTPPTTAPPSGTTSLSEKIPDPKEFDGSRNDLNRFIQQIYGKMNANADRFPHATNRMTYVAGRLTGKAYSLILPKIKYGIPQFIDYPQMLEYLEKAFGDPDRTQNAQNKLFQLKQRNSDFSAYFSEFQRLALESEMPENALVPLLFQGISRELQDMLLHSPAPSSEYTAYVNHLQTLDNRYRQHQQQVSRNRTGNRLASTPTTPASKTDVPQDADPMDLSTTRRQQNSFNSQGRRERGECYRCGSSSHLVAACPVPAPTRNPAQFRETRLDPSPKRYSLARKASSPKAPSRGRSPSPAFTEGSAKGIALV